MTNADGSGSHVLLKDAGMMVSSAGLRYLGWSPDGRHLAFEMGYGPYSIYVVGADGSGLERLISHGTHPEWSPDGSRIAYNSPTPTGLSRLRIADADGTHVQRFDGAGSGPWNPLPRAESRMMATSAAARSTRLDALIHAIAAPVAMGVAALLRRRKRKAWPLVEEQIA